MFTLFPVIFSLSVGRCPSLLLPLETEGEQELDTTSNKESQGQLSRHERQLTAPTPFGLDKKRPIRGQTGPKGVQREEENAK